MTKPIKVLLVASAAFALAAIMLALPTKQAKPSLSFSGFTDQGTIAVLTFTNTSRFHDAEVWFAGIKGLTPCVIGDCQIKTKDGRWLDRSKTRLGGGASRGLSPTMPGGWVHYDPKRVVDVVIPGSLTLPPGGHVTVQMEVPRFVPIETVEGTEVEVADLHSPWRTGLRVTPRMRWPKLLSFLRRNQIPSISHYPPGTIMLWSEELTR